MARVLFPLPDHEVSRQHCEVRLFHGEMYVRDLRSTPEGRTHGITLHSFEAELRRLERDFNEGQKHEDAIRSVLSSVKYVMNTFDLPHINSAEDLHDVIEMTLEPSEVRTPV